MFGGDYALQLKPEIKSGIETDCSASCLLIDVLFVSSAVRRFLSLDNGSPHKCSAASYAIVPLAENRAGECEPGAGASNGQP